MTAFLDTYPLPWSDARLRELRDLLSAVVYRDTAIEMIVADAGLPLARIAWGQSAHRLWFDVLNLAADFRQLPDLLDAVRKHHPGCWARIDEVTRADAILPADLSGTDSDGTVRWKNFASDTHERQIFTSEETLLDVAYLQHGLDRAGAVCRLTVTHPTKRCLGTGFRIGQRTLLTNHHVLYAGGMPAIDVVAEFGYELDTTGTLRKGTAVACAAESIRGDRTHDFAIITVAEPIPEDVPVLALERSVTVRAGDRVSIIQHPHGLPKKIAMHHNVVKYVDDDVVQYWTDTEAGSSGSPVFDDCWRVVALHHKWVPTSEDDGTAYRNQGRAIGRVLDRIAELGLDSGQV
nr:trypsin-like peptidase domain-containing protein [Kibdelosporangium sp. MJ126-NF4]CEL14461.1 hypothetical protein [Kibdelosporangium sp. MJ126-NF4]CTQ88826.1 hypothetical protein [Kibdelosporangium sp. MJ126-NF4]